VRSGIHAGILSCALLLVSSGLLDAATRYVSPVGSDRNPGTARRPFRTLSQAVRIAAPGDTILLRDGVYGAEGVANGSFAVWVSRSGTASAWIVVKAEHKGRAILDCQNRCSGYLYFDTGAAYWHIENLVFDHAAGAAIHMNSTPAAHDLAFKGNEIRNVGRHYSDSQYGMSGVYAGEGHYNLTFDGNVFHDIGRIGPIKMQAHDHGLYLHSSNTKIINNIFYGPISGWGIQTANGFSGLIANNTFAFPMSSQVGQLTLWGKNGEVTIRNNIFYKPAETAIHVWEFTSRSCIIDHNVVYGTGRMIDRSGCVVGVQTFRDPLFLNVVTAPYDFHLRSGSPAIDSGAPVPGIAADFDGAPRPAGSGFDAGAYERRTGGNSHALPGESNSQTQTNAPRPERHPCTARRELWRERAREP
jgi:hypothetical protein